MNTRFIRYGLLFFALAAAFGSCIEPPEFSNTPAISNASVAPPIRVTDNFSQSQKDSLVISVRFQDGDGDLGVTATEREDTTVTYRDWGNYELTTYRYSRGEFIEVPLLVNKRLFFSRLKSDDKASPIEGTLDFSQSFYYDRFSTLTPVKFRIRIRDRALHVSNTIETDTVSIPLSY